MSFDRLAAFIAKSQFVAPSKIISLPSWSRYKRIVSSLLTESTGSLGGRYQAITTYEFLFGVVFLHKWALDPERADDCTAVSVLNWLPYIQCNSTPMSSFIFTFQLIPENSRKLLWVWIFHLCFIQGKYMNAFFIKKRMKFLQDGGEDHWYSEMQRKTLSFVLYTDEC